MRASSVELMRHLQSELSVMNDKDRSTQSQRMSNKLAALFEQLVIWKWAIFAAPAVAMGFVLVGVAIVQGRWPPLSPMVVSLIGLLVLIKAVRELLDISKARRRGGL